MRNLLLFLFITCFLSTTAKNAEVTKVLDHVLTDSIIHKYMLKYGGTDSSGYVVFKNEGDYYIYNGSHKTKEIAQAHPTIGVIKKMRISPKRAIVKIYVTNNHFKIRAKLSRIDNCQPWLIESRLISNLFQISNLSQKGRDKKSLFHYSNG